MSHTNTMEVGSKDIKQQFVPKGCEAAWALFHYTGMFGTSEAAAESVGSILKRYQKANLSTSRIVESAILRWNGISGEGGEDQFLQLCWAKFFGSVDKKEYSFDYRGRAGAKRRKQSFYGGSIAVRKTIEFAGKGLWKPRDLKLATSAGLFTSPADGLETTKTKRSLEWQETIAAKRAKGYFE